MTSDKCTSKPTRFSKARLLAWADLLGGSDRVKFAARAEYKAFTVSRDVTRLRRDTDPEHAAMQYLNAAADLGSIDFFFRFGALIESLERAHLDYRAATKRQINEWLIDTSEAIYRSNQFEYAHGREQLRGMFKPAFEGTKAHRLIDRAFEFGKTDAIRRTCEAFFR
jgi:hypothetical protein